MLQKLNRSSLVAERKTQMFLKLAKLIYTFQKLFDACNSHKGISQNQTSTHFNDSWKFLFWSQAFKCILKKLLLNKV